MNGWLVSPPERSPYSRIIGDFLLDNARLPDPILANGVRLVGFQDECETRQSTSFFQCFADFLMRMGESSFGFIWFPDGYKSLGTKELYPIYLCESLPAGPTDFVRLQSDHDIDAFQSDAWLLTSITGRWAIYGEHYGSEMALLLSRDSSVTAAMLGSFPELITDPSIALATIGDQSQTEEGAHFEHEFLKNYSTVR